MEGETLRHWLPDYRDTPLDEIVWRHLKALGQGSVSQTQTRR